MIVLIRRSKAVDNTSGTFSQNTAPLSSGDSESVISLHSSALLAALEARYTPLLISLLSRSSACLIDPCKRARFCFCQGKKTEETKQTTTRAQTRRSPLLDRRNKAQATRALFALKPASMHNPFITGKAALAARHASIDAHARTQLSRKQNKNTSHTVPPRRSLPTTAKGRAVLSTMTPGQPAWRGIYFFPPLATSPFGDGRRAPLESSIKAVSPESDAETGAEVKKWRKEERHPIK